jgi:hypothetical protein
MLPYVHVTLISLDGTKVWLSLRLVFYTEDETKLCCEWNPKHKVEKRKLFRDGEDIRCFDYVPWGRQNTFNRVGCL